MTFPCVFGQKPKNTRKSYQKLMFFGQKLKNTRKSHRKLMSFRHLFGLNFEDEGAICGVFPDLMATLDCLQRMGMDVELT